MKNGLSMILCIVLSTFSSFQHIVDHVRSHSYSSAYSSTMSPPVMQQIVSSMKIIMGEDGTDEGNIEKFIVSSRLGKNQKKFNS